MFSLTAANVITVIRILLVPVLVVALFTESDYGSILAALVFVVAALSDGLDGYLARSRDSVTSFGKLMDPIADKLLITAALISLVSLRRVEAWVAMVIIGREFAVTVLRLAVAQDGVVISASILGKIKTVTQVVAILALIAVKKSELWVSLLVYLAVATTLISGADYFLSLRKHLLKARKTLDR